MCLRILNEQCSSNLKLNYQLLKHLDILLNFLQLGAVLIYKVVLYERIFNIFVVNLCYCTTNIVYSGFRDQ